jgi:hypothetical protein
MRTQVASSLILVPDRDRLLRDTLGERELREFRFVIQGYKEIVATTQAGSPGSSRWPVLLSPCLDSTDGDLYGAALHCLWHLYGTRRGLFQFEDMRLRTVPELGGKAMCWRIENPDAEYWVLPNRDERSGKISGLTVWVK